MNHEHIPSREVITPFLRRREAINNDRFLKGPISWRSISMASNLTGQSLAVYLCVQHISAMSRRDWIKLPPSTLRAMGVSRDSKSRSLRELAAVGLVELKNSVGRASLVRLTA